MNDDSPARRWRELRRVVLRHRRLLAAGLAAASVAVAIAAVRPPPPPTVAVLAAARDLSDGTPLGQHDLRTARLPAAAVPAGAVRPDAAVQGLVLAGPMRRGELLTDARVLGPGLLAVVGGDDGELVAAPVRIADAEVARLLHAGDRVDVLAADAPEQAEPSARPARTVAADVRVLVVPRTAEASGFGSTGPADGALVVLAARPEVAADLARAAVTSRLSLTLRG